MLGAKVYLLLEDWLRCVLLLVDWVCWVLLLVDWLWGVLLPRIHLLTIYIDLNLYSWFLVS